MYRPLDEERHEIRVLEILPPSDLEHGLVRCKLKHVSLSDESYSPRYKDFKLQSSSQQEEWKDVFSDGIDCREENIEGTSLNYHEIPVHAASSIPEPDPLSSQNWTNGHRYTWGDFEALSYMWGDQTVTRQIQLDGSVVPVTQNLEAALRILHDLPETQNGMQYWIDALCINQYNVEERNRQVKRMKDIYGKARALVVWLGESEAADDKAVQFIWQLNRTVLQEPDGPIVFLHRFEESLVAVGLFFRKLYWQRLWIIQELAVNHHSTIFICGALPLTRRMIRVAAAFWQRHIETIQHMLQAEPDGLLQHNSLGDWYSAYRVHTLLSILPKTDPSNGLHDLLHLCRNAEASDERDKVYGILGLMSNEISSKVDPDYRSAIEDIYKNFSRLIIETTGELDVLFCWTELSAFGSWPTWVPDWRLPFSRKHIQYLTKRHASGDSTGTTAVSDESLLICKGFQVDRIDGLSYASYADSSNAVEVVQPRSNLCRYPETTLSEVISATLSLDHPGIRKTHSRVWLPRSIDQDSTTPEQSTHYERFHLFQRKNEMLRICGRKFSEFFPSTLNRFPASEDISTAMNNIRLTAISLIGRRLSISESGFLGLVPISAKRGDVIAVLLGCNFPVVLRPHNGAFRVVGECYVHDLMDGEVFRLEREGHCLLEEIILS